MGDSVENLAEVEADHIHCSPLIYPDGHAIIECYQSGQAGFPHGEFMLTTPDNLPFLHLLNDDLQNVSFKLCHILAIKICKPKEIYYLC